MLKKCKKCNIEKENTEEFFRKRFYKNSNQYYFTGECKDCIKKYSKEYDFKNKKSKITILFIDGQKICKECKNIKEINKINFPYTKYKEKIYFNSICRECINTYTRQYNVDNKEKLNEKAKIRRNKNIEEEREKDRQRSITPQRKESHRKSSKKIYDKNKNNFSFKLRQSVSKLINKALKSKNATKNKNSCFDFLLYNPKELNIWIENQFSVSENLTSDGKIWMNKENYGKYNKKTWDDNDPSTWTWELDHIIPQSDLQYTSMEDENFKICWSLENLRPYSAKQNSKDGASRIRHKNKSSK